MKRAEVFKAAELPGLNDASERASARTENPGAGQCPEGGKAGLSKAGLKREQEGSKGADEDVRHRGALLSFIDIMKDKELKKSASALLSLLQEIQAQT